MSVIFFLFFFNSSSSFASFAICRANNERMSILFFCRFFGPAFWGNSDFIFKFSLTSSVRFLSFNDSVPGSRMNEIELWSPVFKKRIWSEISKNTFWMKLHIMIDSSDPSPGCHSNYSTPTIVDQSLRFWLQKGEIFWMYSFLENDPQILHSFINIQKNNLWPSVYLAPFYFY